ncbi:hypothetical protein ACNTMW_18145 [Planosporangium sp. 12N6]|uniref:hypothetical protein n=1 Tax=Planosporangium spinosum TaxID=3402278 RepID=UPI003CF5F2D7
MTIFAAIGVTSSDKATIEGHAGRRPSGRRAAARDVTRHADSAARHHEIIDGHHRHGRVSVTPGV